MDSGLGALVPLKAMFPNSPFKEGAMERTRLVQLAEVPYSAGWLFTWHILPRAQFPHTLPRRLSIDGFAKSVVGIPALLQCPLFSWMRESDH